MDANWKKEFDRKNSKEFFEQGFLYDGNPCAACGDEYSRTKDIDGKRYCSDCYFEIEQFNKENKKK